MCFKLALQTVYNIRKAVLYLCLDLNETKTNKQTNTQEMRLKQTNKYSERNFKKWDNAGSISFVSICRGNEKMFYASDNSLIYTSMSKNK